MGRKASTDEGGGGVGATGIAPTAPNLELLAFAEEAGVMGIFQWQVATNKVTLSPWLMKRCKLDYFDQRYDSWMACVHREDRVRLADEFAQAFKSGAARIVSEFRLHAAGGGEVQWMEARSLISYDAEGEPDAVVGVQLDISERKRSLVQVGALVESMEDRVRERTRELEIESEARRMAEDSMRQMQKMEAVGQLAGGIAHDFNNMLAVILGALDLIESRLARGQDVSALIAGARHGATRAAELTQRLLAFSRQLPLKPKIVQPNRLVADMSEMLRRTLGETITIETVLAGGLGSINVDESQLENAILNIAINARDAMPEGGTLTIETGNAHLDDEYAREHAEVKAGEYVIIAITDTGAGMAADVIERAFDPFFTTKEVGKGTGLGLSQIFGYVKQSRGHTKIYSKPGQGATVKLYFPRHDGGAEPAPSAKGREGAPRGGVTDVILLVEDDDRMREITIESLGELGYTVIPSSSGAEALRLLSEHPGINLLLTDVVMPQMNGRQLADAAVNLRSDLKVLFMTGYARDAVVHNGVVDHGVNLLTKPFDLDQLALKLREVLAQQKSA
jgi:signal transduction histidine kinase/CheY-like chemotaxis protein